MTPREQVLACLSGDRPDCVPMRDAPLPLALERWESEGMPKGEFPAGFFDHCLDGTGFDDSLRLPEQELENDGRVRLFRDANGVTHQQLCHSSSTSHATEFLIKSSEDWKAYKDRLTPDRGRMSDDALALYRNWNAQRHRWVCLSVVGPFGYLCGLIGMTRTLEVMSAEPDWFTDVARTLTDYQIGMLEIVRGEDIRLDGIFQYDDVTFITGAMFSPAMYRNLIMPFEKQLYDYVHGNGGHVYRHTDGNNWKLLPHLIEAGIDFLDPLEVKAGMDLREVKEAFGRQAVWVGNVDARVLYRGDKREIEEEVRRKLSVFPDGGYIFRTDGPITEEASLESYRWLIACVKRYGGYPAMGR
ncbi:MAG: uroporphyrinogen decarboxylase family protein [Kiritimatiellae bacterium]|nr:uroporphyrinogen decarboxylase family protein [Kiritimatiellia bacterium]